MAHTRTWNAAYEANPADVQDADQGAARIREVKVDVGERLALDHVMDETDDDGYHKQVTLEEQASAPGNLANKFRLYAKEADSKTEMFVKDEDGNELQVTKAGKLLLLDTHNDWTAGQAVTQVNITYGSTITPDAAESNAFRCALTGNVILAPPTNPKSGQILTLLLVQDATGGRTLTFGATIYGNSALDWTLSTAASKTDMLVLFYDIAVTSWRALALHKDIHNAL
jgi:hypothetical protein